MRYKRKKYSQRTQRPPAALLLGRGICICGHTFYHEFIRTIVLSKSAAKIQKRMEFWCISKYSDRRTKEQKRKNFIFQVTLPIFCSFVLLSESLWNTRQHQTVIPCTRAMSACRYSVTPVLQNGDFFITFPFHCSQTRRLLRG